MHAGILSTPGPLGGQTALQALVFSVVDLLNTATRQLDVNRDAARASISRASSLLWVEAHKDFERDAIRAGRGALLGWQIRRVREYVDAHLSGRILVSDLSTIAQRSEAHFARAFKRTFRVSPHAYILRRRVDKASHLMLVSDDSLSDIALACGMTDQAHLCNIFRQLTGRTPAAWRRERRAFSMNADAAIEVPPVPARNLIPITAFVASENTCRSFGCSARTLAFCRDRCRESSSFGIRP